MYHILVHLLDEPPCSSIYTSISPQILILVYSQYGAVGPIFEISSPTVQTKTVCGFDAAGEIFFSFFPFLFVSFRFVSFLKCFRVRHSLITDIGTISEDKATPPMRSDTFRVAVRLDPVALTIPKAAHHLFLLATSGLQRWSYTSWQIESHDKLSPPPLLKKKSLSPECRTLI